MSKENINILNLENMIFNLNYGNFQQNSVFESKSYNIWTCMAKQQISEPSYRIKPCSMKLATSHQNVDPSNYFFNPTLENA